MADGPFADGVILAGRQHAETGQYGKCPLHGSQPVNNRSRDSVDMFIGRDWIAIAWIKFRQTGRKVRVCGRHFDVFCGFLAICKLKTVLEC
jgi:hypothetical protein